MEMIYKKFRLRVSSVTHELVETHHGHVNIRIMDCKQRLCKVKCSLYVVST